MEQSSPLSLSGKELRFSQHMGEIHLARTEESLP